MKIINAVSTIVFLPVFSLSCGKKNKNEKLSVPPLLNTIFIKGDPLNIIKGSTVNSKSFINTDNYTELDNYELSSIYQFSEK